MKQPSETEEMVLSFKRPNARIYLELHDLFASLSPVPLTKASLKRADAFVFDSAGSLLSKLKETLQADLESHNSVSDRAYEFDYVVMRNLGIPRKVSILTRLHSAAKSGNIFYGRFVARPKDNEYLLWIDD